MAEINLPYMKLFWTEDKYAWFRDYKDINPKDEGAKQEMVAEFNKNFKCNKSGGAVYGKYRTMHHLRPLKKFGSEKIKRCKTRSGGNAGFKSNEI